MKTTIEMFLCLARETDDGLYDEQFLVMPLVSQAIEQQRHLLSGKLVDIEIGQIAKPKVCGHPQAFSIAVNNLVRNAFEHTLAGQGPITILIKEHELLITNQMSTLVTNQERADERTEILNMCVLAAQEVIAALLSPELAPNLPAGKETMRLLPTASVGENSAP